MACGSRLHDGEIPAEVPAQVTTFTVIVDRIPAWQRSALAALAKRANPERSVGISSRKRRVG